MQKEEFVKRSHIQAPVETVFKWHARPGALERLSPPWDPIVVIDRQGGIQKGGKTVLKMKAGPIPYQWEAEHFEYIENQLFQDRQLRGPFASWTHSHIFEPDGQSACFLEDRIEYALPFQPFGHFVGRRMIPKQLERIFTYRHETTIKDIQTHLKYSGKKPLHILISGASGVVGSALIPFLTTGGHQVTRLVRRSPKKGEIYWNPQKDELDLTGADPIDAVIHLAGENIGQGRWTPEKKKRIIESRTRGTNLIARRIAELDNPPRIMISASAIGYYGHRADEILTEEDACGADFISNVCNEWEKAAKPAIDHQIRVVFLRIGVALTPAGGALERLLLPFTMGIGGKIGSGKQYISWIGIDDVIGAIHHILISENIEGPINIVSPYPVTNEELTQTLGKVLNRPALLPAPEIAVKLMFGEMGKEVPLSSTRVLPEKLAGSGYPFRYPDLEPALRHVLGKTRE